MTQNTAAKGRVILLLLGIVVGSAGGYFLNWIYPFETLVGPSPWVEDTESPPNPPNGLLQSETVQSMTTAKIDGIDILEMRIPEMEVNLTTQANSTVELTFIASYFISLMTDFQYGAEFNVSILVDGAAVMTLILFAYRTSVLVETEYEGGNLAMSCMVPQLTAGEHSFEVVSFSLHTKNYCFLHIRPSGYNFERYFTVNEWASQ
ncbi:MAG: hypothetical protein ACTSWW_03775 [Promethearchaeota archaeon]